MLVIVKVLKDGRRLPLPLQQLFLCLLLMMSTIPGQSEGLTCLQCVMPPKVDPGCMKTKYVNCTEGAICVKMQYGDTPTIERRCYAQKADADCVLAATGAVAANKDCYSMPDRFTDQGQQLLEELLNQCVPFENRNLGNSKQDKLIYANTTIDCFCSTDKCDPSTTDFVAVKEIKPNPDGPRGEAKPETKKKSAGNRLQFQFNFPGMILAVSMIALPVYSKYVQGSF